MFMKTHFSYNPMNDRLIPSKEAGLQFQDGDILMILNHDDPNWWQVSVHSDSNDVPHDMFLCRSCQPLCDAFLCARL